MKPNLPFELTSDETAFLMSRFKAHNLSLSERNLPNICLDDFIQIYTYGLFRADYVFFKTLLGEDCI